MQNVEAISGIGRTIVVGVERCREEEAGECKMAILAFAPKQADFIVGCSSHLGAAFVLEVERACPKDLKIESGEAELSEFDQIAIK